MMIMKNKIIAIVILLVALLSGILLIRQGFIEVEETRIELQEKRNQDYLNLLRLEKKDLLTKQEELKTKRKEVIAEAQSNVLELMTWLYANQGEMRFGAENRLFVILVDSTDMNESWKMKRAFALIEPKVKDYLDNFNEDSLKEISFKFKGNQYKSLADVIFVVK